MRRANAGAPNSDWSGLVQYPHKTHERSSSGNRDQNGECRYLPPGKAVVI
jgi:hypothetical protein